MHLLSSRFGLFVSVLVVAALFVIPVIGQPPGTGSEEGRMVEIDPTDVVTESCIECHLELHGNPMETAGQGLKVEGCMPCHEWMHKEPVRARTQTAKITFRRPTGDFEAGKEYEGQLKTKMGEIYMFPERHLRVSPGRSPGIKFVKEEGDYVFFTVFLQGRLKIDDVEVTFVPWEFQVGDKKATVTAADVDEAWFQIRGRGGYASIDDYKKTYPKVDSGPAGGGTLPLAFSNYDIPSGFGSRRNAPGDTAKKGKSKADLPPMKKGAASKARPVNQPRPIGERGRGPLGQIVFNYDLEKARPYHFVARPDGQIVVAGSNQIALWIEDEDGYYVDTVFVTRLAGRWGYRYNLATLPMWRKASRWDLVSREEADAVSGPTQKPGAKTLVWDCSDWRGNPVAPGTYTYRLEANLQMANLALWNGKIEIGPEAESSEATLRRIPEGNTAYLIVKDVKARFQPASSTP